MADRKFEYDKVAEAHGNMKTATEAIRDTLVKINDEYSNKVNVVEQAIYGNLGGQLLMDWENVSSNFPSFYEKFGTWSLAVASTSGEYADFENRFSGFKSAIEETKKSNPLGSGTAGAGRTENYISGGTYAAFGKEYLEKYKNGEVGELSETGAYVLTGTGNGTDSTGSTSGVSYKKGDVVRLSNGDEYVYDGVSKDPESGKTLYLFARKPNEDGTVPDISILITPEQLEGSEVVK